MQCSIIFLLSLAVVVHSVDGLAIGKRGRTTEQTNFLSQFNGTALAQLGTDKHHAPSAVLQRPNAGKGPETVKFGVRAMNFYGADLKHHTFSIDMVMSIRWNDPRVATLIPQGLEKLSMARDQAELIMWMPGMVVSNRDIEKYEIISASVTIYKTGEVHRVERANTRVMKKFMLESYPFDTQTLTINLASSKYMLDEVVLVPDEGASGVYEDIWGLYTMHKWNTSAFETHDGELVKSRGTLNIDVERSLEKYSQDHLLPASIVLMISWAVFYFPFANPFITARLALSILALLTFTNLIVKSGKELPGAAPFNWNDLFNQQIQALMFVTIVLNVCSEISFHTFQKEALARGLNNDAKVLMPFMSVLNIILILGGGAHHWMTLANTTIVTQVVLVVLLAAYAGYALYKHIKREEAKTASDGKGEQDEEQCAVAGLAVMGHMGDGEGEGEAGDDAGDAGDC